MKNHVDTGMVTAPPVRHIGHFRTAHGIMTAFYGAVIMVAINVVLHEALAWDYLPLGLYVAVPALFAFAPMFVGNLWQSVRVMLMAPQLARLEAGLESLMQRDLNGSGSIGDLPTPEPQIIETIRPVAVAAYTKRVGDLPAQDLREFITKLPERGLSRSGWRGYRFESGRVWTRQFHDEAMTYLDRIHALEGRGKGTDGYLTKPIEQIIEDLGVALPDKMEGQEETGQ